ncbi:MAG TPA: PIN domain nuclease [Spirochaetales bacterium]|nr:PIN domain nuclease [Spirochaetales bacterium]
MNVLVDTSIWSLAFRRKKLNHNEKELTVELTHLIEEVRALIIGPIRQEILSGISNSSQHALLKKQLKAFDDVPITTEDYETAAEFHNICRQSGVQGSHIDYLICAVAYRHGTSIFTTDRDFMMFSKHLEIELYEPRAIT